MCLVARFSWFVVVGFWFVGMTLICLVGWVILLSASMFDVFLRRVICVCLRMGCSLMGCLYVMM